MCRVVKAVLFLLYNASVLSAVDGVLVSDLQRRLLYVALTRAKKFFMVSIC
jgi:ATP-dependent exoDNAse (exonuclease V) alpha subunit